MLAKLLIEEISSFILKFRIKSFISLIVNFGAKNYPRHFSKDQKRNLGDSWHDVNAKKTLMSWLGIVLFEFIFHFSYFFLAPMCIHPKEKNHGHLPHWILLPCGHTQDVLKWGHVFHLWSLFWICAFLPLLGSCEGKTQKRQVVGENKNKWRQLSPRSPSTQITSTHLHTSPPPTLTLFPWSPWWYGGEGWPNVPLFWL